MAKFEIEGGTKISGNIKVAGNKNSVLPMMTASLLTNQLSTIENVPQISDVDVMIKLLEIAEAKITKQDSKITIDPANLKETEFPVALTEKLRASVLLLGPMLARFGKAKIGYPGGDIIGRRSLDSHLQVFEAFGAKVEESDDSISVFAKSLKPTQIFLQEASVTATENALMIACPIPGQTTIKRAATEPHIVDLCNFLVKMGAQIEGIGTNVLKITGTRNLAGASHIVRPDHIEVGTFAILAAVTQGKITIAPIIGEDLEMILGTLSKFGVDYKIENDKLTVFNSKLHAVDKVVTDVWPGFPTDLMAPMIVLATQAEGATLLHDWMYESRMFFVDKLLSMGAKVDIADPHRVLVYGPTKLRGQRLDTPDIRAGIALAIAALAAKGKSEIEKAELIERGYENIVDRLSALGAKIKRIP